MPPQPGRPNQHGAVDAGRFQQQYPNSAAPYQDLGMMHDPSSAAAVAAAAAAAAAAGQSRLPQLQQDLSRSCANEPPFDNSRQPMPQQQQQVTMANRGDKASGRDPYGYGRGGPDAALHSTGPTDRVLYPTCNDASVLPSSRDLQPFEGQGQSQGLDAINPHDRSGMRRYAPSSISQLKN